MSSEFLGVVTQIGQQKLAASIGGTPVVPAVIRVGDGNGAPITPTSAMTDLVRRVGNAYPVTASVRDPDNPAAWRVSTLIPAGDGPFDIREIGVFDAQGQMLAIARHVLVEKRTPAQGAAIELATDIIFPVSETAQVAVAILTSDAVSLRQQLRAGWMTVNSASLAAPPANPATGATYIVAANPTGAWAGLAGMIVQWTGTAWVAADAPVGHVVSVQDVAESAALRYQRRTAAGWVSASASTTAYGVMRRSNAAELAAHSTDVVVTPADLASWAASGQVTPGPHVHAIADITSLQPALDGKVARAGDTMTGALTAPTVTVTGSLTGTTILQASKQVLDRSTDPRAASGSYLTGGSKEAGGIAVDVAGLFPAGRRFAAGVIDHTAVAAGYTWPISGGTITAAAFGAAACSMDVTFATLQPDLQYSVRGIAIVNGVPNVNITLSNKTTTSCKINFPPPYAAIESLAALFELYR